MLLLLLLRSVIASFLWAEATAFHYCHHSAATALAQVHPAQQQLLSQSSPAADVCRSPHEQRQRQRRSSIVLSGVIRSRAATRSSLLRQATPSSSGLQASSSSSQPPHEQGLQQEQQQQQPAAGTNGGNSGSCSTEKSTLGIAHHVLEQTIVPGLVGAVLKESPSDFVVVEIPQHAGAKFTPADPDEPVPKEARKPVVHSVPPVDTVVAAIKEWQERWPTGVAFQGPEEPPADELEQMRWNLGKGFDVIAQQLGAPASMQLQEWLLRVATRVAFDAEEEKEAEEGISLDVLLPPPEASRQIFLRCPERLDKAGRTTIHEAFREHMTYFSTSAVMPPPPWSDAPEDPRPVPDDGRVYIEVSFETRTRAAWPKGRGDYLEFSVYKAGRSTSEAAEALCQRLYIKRTRLSFAGSKDRRALTAQKMRAWRLPAETIHRAQAEGVLAEHGLLVSDFRFVETDFSLGGLKGNHFDVVLRPPPGGWGRGEGAQEAAARGGGVSAAVAFRRIRDEGFVNFFGEQRFGRDGTNNLEVGLLLLRSEWAQAIDRVMAPHPADNPMVAQAKEAFFRGDDYDHAMSLLPRTAFVERKIMKALRDVGSDPLRAMLELPRELCLLFVQAYQSLLWNRAASRRMGGEFDTKMAVEGDLVLVKGPKPLTAWDTRPKDENKSDHHAPPSSRGGGRGLGGGRGGRGAAAGKNVQQQQQQQVVRVSAEAARAGVFTIKHVVIPLPGRSVLFPWHSVGQEMVSTLKQDGLARVILNGHRERAFDLEGAYRHVVVHPRNFGAQPMPPGAENDTTAGDGDDDGANAEAEAEAEAEADVLLAEQIGAVRDARGGMPPATTAAWLRARFRGEVKQRFKGSSSSSSRGAKGVGA
ncbi:unnamed protein product, partial [Pylaiella littoralis]